MESHFFFLWILVICFGANCDAASSQLERYVSLQSLDSSDLFVRACVNINKMRSAYVEDIFDDHGRCSGDGSYADRESTFIMREPGLTGEPGTVSFESFQFTDYYLVHTGHKVWVKRSVLETPTKRFKKHATFRKVTAHADCVPGTECFSFESVVTENTFLQHCTYSPTGDLVVGNNKGACKTDGATFAKQTTFELLAPFAT